MKTKLLFLIATLFIAVGTWAQSEDMLSTPLTFEAFEEGTLSFKNRSAGPVTYRVNGGETQTVESMKEVEIPLAIDDKVEFFGDNATYYDEENDKNSHFKMSSNCYIYGNIMSLISSSNFATAKTLTGKRCFIKMFRDSHVRCHPTHELLLPATTLTEYCYYSMFEGSGGLSNVILPAPTLVEGCYAYMFRMPSSRLTSVTCLATDISATDATLSWLGNPTTTGTFIKHPDMKDWPTGANGIPEGWTVVDYDMTGINAKTSDTKKTPATTYDLRGMKSAAGKKGLKIVGDKKIMTK